MSPSIVKEEEISPSLFDANQNAAFRMSPENDAICSKSESRTLSRSTFTPRSTSAFPCGIIVLVIIVLVTVSTVTVLVRKNDPLQSGMTQEALAGYKGNCVLVSRETRLVDFYREEAASVNMESKGSCVVSVADQEVLNLEGSDCDTAAAAQCVAFPFTDWCAHEEYKPFCLPQNECTNPYEFDASILSESVYFEKCENGVLMFTFNGTYSNDAPLIKNVVDGKLVIDASGTVTAINNEYFTLDGRSSDPNIVVGKDVSIMIITNAICDETKSNYVCENLMEWLDELDTWRPWEYPCWITPEIGEGKIASKVQVEELC